MRDILTGRGPRMENIMDYEYISNTKLDSYARRLEKKNLREKGRSLCATGISRAANPFIIEIRDSHNDKCTVVIKEGWREAMKLKAGEAI